MDETELIAAARLGDEDAFRELYQQHIAYVRAVGRAVLRRNDVDDLCQDTFLLAFTRLHSFEGNAQFRTWITRIATNQCLVTLRNGRRTPNCAGQPDEEMNMDEVLDRYLFASRDKNLEGVAVRLDMEKLLSMLTPSQRRVMEMAYLENIPAQEIAEMLGSTLKAVKNKLSRGKRRIRNLYK